MNVMTQSLENKSILLIISGGIAAYKSLELIRLIRKSGGRVRCILTQGGSKFVTPLSVGALSENTVYDDLWSLKDETEMGHIRLSREADLIVIAPASANLIAQYANGLAADLASTALLATDKPVLIAPAMNHKMWLSAATQDNIAKLTARGAKIIGPVEGDMACGEFGPGRMSEPEDILAAIKSFFFEQPLKGLSALVTSGPTFEPLDPVRFIGNRSSGKQGHAIAKALADAGAAVTLISGPVSLPDPAGVTTIHVETAAQMLAASERALPADIAVMAAAVADWSPTEAQEHKIKKRFDHSAQSISLKENADILKTVAHHKKRPQLVIGFAAETENLEANAREKIGKKGCDWIMANNVSENVFGTDQNHVYHLTSSATKDWGTLSKTGVADKLVTEISEFFNAGKAHRNAAE
jgi:phosphopantothenoylcysteine decarboxylase/phosphopantothenate--cysteine ligase